MFTRQASLETLSEVTMSTSLHLSLLILTLLWSKSSANPAPGLKAVTPFSFDDIFDASLRPRGFSPTWIAGEESFYYRSAVTGNIMRRNAQTQEEIVLVNKTSFDEVGAGTYFMSHDLSGVLFAYETQSLWRHSFDAKYKILNLTTGVFTDFPFGFSNDTVLNYARWAPSSNALSFVHQNDLYYQSSPTDPPIRITTDGHATDIFNGVPDWLYEEDVLGDRVTHYWSPDSTHICFAKINASQVPFISWPLYGDKSNVFGSTREIRYPKAGDVKNGQPGPNSVAELYLVDVNDPLNPVKISPPADLQDEDHYYVQVAWGSASALYVTWTNRVQNYSSSALYDISNTPIVPAKSLTLLVEGGWVEVAPPEPLFIDSGTYITIHPRDRGTSGKWRQLGVYNRTTHETEIRHWISADKEEEVDGIYGYDAANKFVYYSSTNGDPTERHIMKASLAVPPTIEPTCLTCDFPDSCRYITSSFSDSGSYYFVNCRGPEVPTYSLRSTLVGQESMNVIMEDNAAVKQLLSEKELPTREFLDIPLGGGYMGKAEIFIPYGHVDGNTYPLLVYAYAGPGSQRVMKTFPMGSNTANWLTYLKSTHKVVIVSVDSRGASGRGDKFKFEMYRNLGTVEVQDQIAAGSHFGEDARVNKDKNKAVFGWSYGGGTAAHVIGDTSEVIKCGISVAPVTTKMYYDTAYTERYLGLATPNDNEAGYNRTDVMNKVENFRNKHFMLNHGMADDNVHYMHTTQLIQALANADILFRQNAFIDQNHGIGSPGPAKHLYHSMTEFLLNDCWDGDTAGSYAPNLQVNVYLASIMSLITALHVFIRH